MICSLLPAGDLNDLSFGSVGLGPTASAHMAGPAQPGAPENAGTGWLAAQTDRQRAS